MTDEEKIFKVSFANPEITDKASLEWLQAVEDSLNDYHVKLIKKAIEVAQKVIGEHDNESSV